MQQLPWIFTHCLPERYTQTLKKESLIWPPGHMVSLAGGQDHLVPLVALPVVSLPETHSHTITGWSRHPHSMRTPQSLQVLVHSRSGPWSCSSGCTQTPVHTHTRAQSPSHKKTGRNGLMRSRYQLQAPAAGHGQTSVLACQLFTPSTRRGNPVRDTNGLEGTPTTMSQWDSLP